MEFPTIQFLVLELVCVNADMKCTEGLRKHTLDGLGGANFEALISVPCMSMRYIPPSSNDRDDERLLPEMGTFSWNRQSCECVGGIGKLPRRANI